MKKDLLIIFSVFALFILSIVACFDGNWIPEHFGFYNYCPTYCRFLYPLFHQNPFHLILNLIMLFQINNFLDRIFEDNKKEKKIICIVSYIICVVATYVSSTKLPTIGLSGYANAKYGVATSLVEKEDVFYILLFFGLFNFIMYFFGSFNCMLHVYCYFVGLIFGLLREYKYR